jgi:hypothetical protein
MVFGNAVEMFRSLVLARVAVVLDDFANPAKRIPE